MTTSYEDRESPIHGRGVFATRNITEGEFIGHYLGRRTDTDGMHTLWIEFDDGLRGYEGIGRLKYVNHAATPNAEFDDRDLYATRTIRGGEEITVHYGEEWAESY